jgi:parallel beta-helix repeat protein
MRRVSTIMSVLVLVSMLVFVFDIQLARADGTVYIRADGSVDPPDAPIQRDGGLYTLTGNITTSGYVDGVVVERSGIVVDGAGYSLEAHMGHCGLLLSGRSNVTIRNLTITSPPPFMNGFYFGVVVEESSDIYILNNTIFRCVRDCIFLHESAYCVISGNNFTPFSGLSVDIQLSREIIIAQNSACGGGFLLSDSTDNTLSLNKITFCYGGIGLFALSSDNNITENNISSCSYAGLGLFDFSDNCRIVGNNITDCGIGISLSRCSNCSLSENTMEGNGPSFSVSGSKLKHFINMIDDSNLIDGKPIHYLVNRRSEVVNPLTYPSVGYLALVNSTDMKIENLTLSGKWQGLLIAYVNNSLIAGNNITGNYDGIYMQSSSHNSILQNSIVANEYDGIFLGWSSDSTANTVCGNNIAANGHDGIDFAGSNSSIAENSIVHNRVGVSVTGNRNSIVRNNITSSHLEGLFAYTDSNSIISNNIISGSGWSGIWLSRSLNMSVYGNSIVGSGESGVFLANSSFNNLVRNRIINNHRGVYLISYSSNNSIVGNNVTGSVHEGFRMRESSGNNIHHNNILNNGQQVFNDAGGIDIQDSINNWNDGYPSGGNYWSDYVGEDLLSGVYQNVTGSDGKGDTPYFIDENNQDMYPRMKPYPPLQTDLNDDGKVDLKDIYSLGRAYGSSPGHPRWNPSFDLNNDGIVDLKDYFSVCKNFGKSQ